MKIGVDMRPALSRKTGVGHYIYYLMKHLILQNAGHQYFLFSASLKDRFPADFLSGKEKNVSLIDRKIPVRFLNHLWHHYRYPPLDQLCGIPLDITYSPTPLILPGRKSLKIVTVHDLYFLTRPDHVTGEMKKDYPALVKKNLLEADAVVCNSKTTLREVEEKLQIRPRKARIISPGLPDGLLNASHLEENALRSQFKITNPYLLHVGMIEPRKNIPLLLSAFQRIRERGHQDLNLVLAGDRGWGWPEVESMVERHPFKDEIHVTGYLREDILASFYRHALMLVFHSRWEGFGMPLLEAMALGLPSVISAAPALVELAGEDGAVVCPDDTPEGLAAAITGLLEDKGRREAIAARGKQRSALFRWEHAAGTMADLFQELRDGF